jgi:dTDP-4-amino-4,6-dideoxygalactose transaminase
MSSSDPGRPAILGGEPVRPAGPPGWPRADESVRQVLRRMVDSGEWGRYHGPHVPELCRRLAEYHSVEHVLTCCSGTSAVELALRGVGVQEGDEVIAAAYDFKANFQNILHLKAVPVLVDLDPATWQLDPTRIEAALSPKTRAIVVSHLHGGVVAMPHVRQIADAHGIAVVEDACQNPGAMLFGRRAGTWGDVGVLSFGGSKLLTAGRGGAILTSRPEIVERIKRHVLRGNDAYPLSEIQAAILRPQIDELDALNEFRRRTVQRLCSLLQSVGGLTPLQLPTDGISPAYYKVGLKYRAAEFGGLPRDSFVEALRAEGIAVDPGFRGNHLIHGVRRFRAADALTGATRADSEMLTLHHPVLLENNAAIEEVVAAIRRVRAYSKEIVSRNCHAP